MKSIRASVSFLEYTPGEACKAQVTINLFVDDVYTASETKEIVVGPEIALALFEKML